jgi:hypothetical protein
MNNTDTTTTSTPSEVAVGLYGAVLAGDLDGARRFLHDDVVLHVPGSHPLAGAHRGPDAFARFIVDSRTISGGEEIELLDLLEGTDHAAAYCRITAQRDDGRRLDNTTVHLVRVRGGRIAEVWLHNWDDLSVNEFWS